MSHVCLFFKKKRCLCSDAIALLDDASTDATVQAVLDVAARVNVEVLITKREWLRNEAQDKNLLLRAARRLGATTFIVVRRRPFALVARVAFDVSLICSRTMMKCSLPPVLKTMFVQ